jgi:transposase
MLSLPSAVKIYVSVSPCDMRKQMDGLAVLVQEGMKREPRSGDMYVFRNRRGDMMKVLFFDQQGFCLLSKRLDKGTFKLSTNSSGTLQLSSDELSN